jgi:hypothetical protein
MSERSASRRRRAETIAKSGEDQATQIAHYAAASRSGNGLNYDWDGNRRNWRMLGLAALVVVVTTAWGLTVIAGLQ